MKPEDVPDDLMSKGRGAFTAFLSKAEPSRIPLLSEQVNAILAAVLPAHERQVRERVAAEILTLWPPCDPEDYEFVHAITDYLRGVCHVCDKPVTAEACSPRHTNLARGGP